MKDHEQSEKSGAKAFCPGLAGKPTLAMRKKLWG